MTQRIARNMSDLIPVSIAEVADLPSDGTNVMMGERAGGIIHIVSLSEPTGAMFFYSVPDPQQPDVLYQIHDADNNPVKLTVAAGRSYALPDELFAARIFRCALEDGLGTALVLLKT